MATVNPTITRGKNQVTFVWTLTGTNQDGTPIGKHWADYPDRSVAFAGVFNSGTLAWEASNDGVVYFNATDPQGNAIAKTANAIEQVMEIAVKQRPNTIATGGALQNVVVTCVARRARSGMEP